MFHPGPGPGNKGTQELASKVAKTCQAHGESPLQNGAFKLGKSYPLVI